MYWSTLSSFCVFIWQKGRIRIRIKVTSRIRIRIRIEVGSKQEPNPPDPYQRDAHGSATLVPVLWYDIVPEVCRLAPIPATFQSRPAGRDRRISRWSRRPLPSGTRPIRFALKREKYRPVQGTGTSAFSVWQKTYSFQWALSRNAEITVTVLVPYRSGSDL